MDLVHGRSVAAVTRITAARTNLDRPIPSHARQYFRTADARTASRTIRNVAT
jgi:hypothetical protein